MPCSLFIGEMRLPLAKSTTIIPRIRQQHHLWVTRQPTFILQQQQCLTTTTTIPPSRQSTSSSRRFFGITALLLGGGGGGLATMYSYNNNNDHHSLQSLWRIGRAALVGIQVAMDYQWSNFYRHHHQTDDQEACHLRNAQRVLKAMQDLGGIYIKLGQHMSAMHYILPDPWTSTLSQLQDQCPVVSSRDELEHLFYEETGQDIHDLFESVEWDTPLGVASLAQVHKATLKKNGQEVAVKWQHPSIATYCHLDLQCVTAVVGAIQWLFPDFGFGWLVDEMNHSLPQELDFTNEAKNANRVRANFKDDPGALVVPEVVWATRRLLCMEYIEGARPDDLEYMKTHNIDPGKVSTEITTIFSKMMFIHGFVHCDPHPGNLLIRPSSTSSSRNFDVVLLDHGQYRTLSKDLRTDYAHLWTSLIRGDENGIETYAYRLGCREPHHRLFASLLTGREWHIISSGQQGLETPTSSIESDRVAGRTGLFLRKIAVVLSSLPRVILLLLKTSDLLRHLDTTLIGTEKKSYETMIQCCNKVVWLDTRQKLWDRANSGELGLWLWLGWCCDYVSAWWDYSSLDWAIWMSQ